jgi:hypothetical protein
MYEILLPRRGTAGDPVTSTAEAAWEAGMAAMRESARQKAIADQQRLLPRRQAVADYLAAHPYASLLEILREVGDDAD